MIRSRSLIAAPMIVFLMGGTAHAALTADQVWQGWKDAAAAGGLALTAATEVNDGGVLTLNGVSLKSADGKGGLTVSDVTLTEEDDGSVTVEPAAEIKLDGAQAEGSGSATITSEALALSVAEGETGLDYGLVADLLSLVVDTRGPEALPPSPGTEAGEATFAGKFALTGVEGGWAGAAGDNNAVAISLTADAMDYDLTNKDNSVGLDSAQTSKSTEVAIEADVTLPKTLALSALTSPEAFTAALNEGLAMSLSMTQGASAGTSREGGMMPMDVTFTGGAGATELSADAAGVVMAATGEGMEIQFKSPMVPVEQITLTTGALEIGMAMPLLAGETAGDYGLMLKLADAVLNEEAWAMFDPNKVLPRDPAQLAIDLGGKLKADMLTLMAAQNGGMTQITPPEPQSFDIREFSVQIAGAALAATGAFTFDNTAVATGGQPVPVGTGTVTLTGGNKLIDGLIATGLLTEQDAAGPRMMMGAFMSPGEGEDVLTSAIEAKADGQILVNGQRVQ